MPTYTFRNNNTGEEWTELMGISASETFLEENPHIEKVPMAINIVGGTGSRIKTDGGMKEILSRIAAANPTSPMAAEYGSKGIKETKTRAAVDKVRKKAGGSLV